MAKSGYFDVPSLQSQSRPSGQALNTATAQGQEQGLRTPESPLPNPDGTPPKVTRPLQVRKKSVPHPPSKLDGGELLAIQRELNETDDHVAMSMGPPPFPPVKREDPRPTDKEEEVSTSPVSPPRKIQIKRKPAPSPNMSPPMSNEKLPFRVIKPSLTTLEKATSVALYFESFYHSLLRPPITSAAGFAVAPSKASSASAGGGFAGENYLLNRARRLADLEECFNKPENRFMSEGEKRFRREELIKDENRILRERRKKVDAKAFEMGRVIGHGAFGVVRIAREKQSGRLVAMKQVSRPRREGRVGSA